MNMNGMNLFSGFGSSSSGSMGLYGLVGEYNNIKSGAYYKALKSYYAGNTSKTSSSSAKNNKTDKTSDVDSQLKDLKNSASMRAYNSVKSEAEELKSAASKLTETGSKSLFAETEKTVKDDKTGEETKVKEVDTKAIQSAVKDFVSAYNDTLKAANKSGQQDIIRNASYMTNQSKIFKRALEEVGISVNADNTLSVDEEKLSSAKTDNLKTLFNGKNSYASFVSKRADMVSSAATKAATSANKFYSNTGKYQNYNTTSNALDWYL